MTAFTLHLLRHGAPKSPGLLMGRTDGEPTADGIAACMAKARTLDIVHLASSDLARARLAGSAIGAVLNLPAAIDPRWRELDFGDWDGRAADDIDPAALERFWSDPDAAPPRGGERWSSLVARTAAAIDELAPVSTLIVTHGGAMRAALHHLCGLDTRQIWAIDLPYAALLSLRVWKGAPAAAQITGLLR